MQGPRLSQLVTMSNSAFTGTPIAHGGQRGAGVDGHVFDLPSLYHFRHRERLAVLPGHHLAGFGIAGDRHGLRIEVDRPSQTVGTVRQVY